MRKKILCFFFFLELFYKLIAIMYFDIYILKRFKEKMKFINVLKLNF